MNLILAAAAMNFKRRMKSCRTEALIRWLLLYKYFIEVYKNFYIPNLKPTFWGTTSYRCFYIASELLKLMWSFAMFSCNICTNHKQVFKLLPRDLRFMLSLPKIQHFIIIYCCQRFVSVKIINAFRNLSASRADKSLWWLGFKDYFIKSEQWKRNHGSIWQTLTIIRIRLIKKERAVAYAAPIPPYLPIK